MSEKHYPTDELGQQDAGKDACAPKPCAKRITHERCADPALRSCITWCSLPAGHVGQCSGPMPRVIEVDDLGPGHTKRRRG